MLTRVKLNCRLNYMGNMEKCTHDFGMSIACYVEHLLLCDFLIDTTISLRFSFFCK